MHILDYSVIIIYFASVVILGLIKSKNSTHNSNNYILAGRKLSLPGFVATLVTTWYGGILGIGENTFNYGIQTWFIFALPYYFFAILFAMFIAPRIRGMQLFSIPDHFSKKFGNGSAIISGIFLLFLASPAPYILSIGILIEYTLGVPFIWSLLLATFISLIYIWKGGFGAIVRTDILQFVLMFGGFILLVFFAWIKIGSPVEVFQQLPKRLLSPTGGNSVQYVIVWFFIALWTFIDPGFYQRSAAASSRKTAKKGIIISVLFWFIFDALTLTSGLYAWVSISSNNSLFAFPALGEYLLPPVFYGLFLVGLLATIMSTIDSLGFISAFTFGRDIIGRINKGNSNSILLTRIGLIIMAIIAVVLAITIPSVVKLWYTIGSIFVPGLLIPFLLTFTKIQMKQWQGLILMILPVVTSIVWFILNKYLIEFQFRSEPFYPGMLTSISIIILIFTTNYKHFNKINNIEN